MKKYFLLIIVIALLTGCAEYNKPVWDSNGCAYMMDGKMQSRPTSLDDWSGTFVERMKWLDKPTCHPTPAPATSTDQ